MLPNEAAEDVVDGFMDAWTCTCIIYIYIYVICIVEPLGAYKLQLGGTYTSSLWVYTFIVSCDPIYTHMIYIYIYTHTHSHLFNFIVVVVARPVHSTSEFVKISFGKCVSHVGSTR